MRAVTSLFTGPCAALPGVNKQAVTRKPRSIHGPLFALPTSALSPAESYLSAAEAKMGGASASPADEEFNENHAVGSGSVTGHKTESSTSHSANGFVARCAPSQFRKPTADDPLPRKVAFAEGALTEDSLFAFTAEAFSTVEGHKERGRRGGFQVFFGRVEVFRNVHEKKYRFVMIKNSRFAGQPRQIPVHRKLALMIFPHRLEPTGFNTHCSSLTGAYLQPSLMSISSIYGAIIAASNSA